MGGSFSNFKGVYMSPVNNPDKKENETSIYRSPDNMDLQPLTDKQTVQDFVKERFEQCNMNDHVIFRRVQDADGNLTSKTYGISYADFKRDAEYFGKGLLDLGLLEWKQEYKDYKLRFCGIYSKNSYRYLVQDMACILYNIVSVPIYDTLGEEATIFAFSNTGMETLCLTACHVEKMCLEKRNDNLPHLKNMIVFDEDLENAKIEELKELVQNAKMNFFTYTDILAKGQTSVDYDWAPVTGDSIYCFSYTSGTTGTPKGAMMSQRNVAITMHATGRIINLSAKDFHLNYLPMPHIFERMMTVTSFVTGCKIGLFNGDTRKLKEDLAIFKPTIFASVPRLYNKFFDAIKTKINEATGLKKKLINMGLNAKNENLEKNGDIYHSFYDMIVFKKMKAILGGRVRIMITASAPLDKEVADFLKICMSCPMVEAYGQTEGTGGEFCMHPNDTGSGHVGGVIKHGECKLVDVPEMNYTSKDVDEKTGEATPRGEIWYRSPGVIPGYYKNDQKMLRLSQKMAG
jgi:long-chain acyl-CoA synthetase